MFSVRENTGKAKEYVRWENVPEGYYTKTTLRRDKRLKPIDESKPDAFVKVFVGELFAWKRYNLYHISNCIPIKTRKRVIVRDIPLTDDNIAEALYLINKSAKKSRDTKVESYFEGRHHIVKRAKTRQYKLYDLKNRVMDKLIREGKAVLKGYHVQSNDSHENTYLKLYQVSQYSFHMLATKDEVEGLEFLGNIERVSSEKVKTSLKFHEAVRLLERYLGDEEKEEQV
ncbi:hypothetical protein GCM10010965_27460 [Caldalkalibacillus thermarum]|uniref:YkyB family protein n=1 Tax=Caldalkalibacillus thermarum TaxID=296745 RepID=UPI001663A3E0|nr:YkyB family protein [Caldalkalibacillus thermarum]GGK33125.1 hypothetical protein GCM10010965_27460 [Caldalkalibacillus thermarum]